MRLAASASLGQVAAMPFPATRAEALAKLDAFLPRAGRAYAARRNFDEGPGRRTAVSELSPAIRRRLLTEAEVARAAVGAHGMEAAAKFVSEVCWRTYWRGWLEARPAVWRRYLADVERLEVALGQDTGLAARYAEAIAGRTGIDAFDAWAHELVETGYLHNHARMSFASIWCFTLRLPWQLGAAHFLRHLLDGCPASNTLGWRWVVGLQTAGKAYLAKADIIRATSGGRFRVEAPLATVALPPEPEPPVPPAALPALPAPDPDAASGLWLHSEDLSPEQMDWPAPVRAVCAVDGIGGDPAAPKRAYANAALADGAARAGARWGVVARLPEPALETAIPEWMAANRLTQLLTPYAPVGPVADRVAPVAAALAARGLRLVPVRRPWDDAAWPHATRGFFHFRQRIPALLA
jgi:deoxyribodipyrimidine photo-lyase